MQGNAQVIERLNALLVGELTAADQYFVHSRMYHDWGLHKLYERVEHERQDEIGHADRLIRRILFLQGTPTVGARGALAIGHDVPTMMKNDLAYEMKVVAALKEAIVFCEQAQDFVTREILVEMLDDTEDDHAHWLEQQLRLIDMLGLQNYLQSAMGEISAS